jgi:hypothetical protein
MIEVDHNSVLESIPSESTMAPLFVSPPNFNFSHLFTKNFGNRFFNPSPPQNLFSSQQDSGFEASQGINFFPGSSQTLPQPFPNLPRSKVERNTSKIKSDMKKLF